MILAFWQGLRTVVTGGASFIGSHLVEALLERGAVVRVADDLSSGSLKNLSAVLGDIEFQNVDLRIPALARRSCEGSNVVFHLAADHGGRGYIDLHQTECAANLSLDQTVLSACLTTGTEKILYASSGCVYPLTLQSDPDTELYLKEELVGPPYEPDGMYGMAKLAGELTLKTMQREHGVAGASCRYFTVYGPRGVENHAVMAMIARAFIKQDPYMVWGTGDQVRNWTYVSDIVSGTLSAAEHIDDATAVNLGTMERVRVIDAVHKILDKTGHSAAIEIQPGAPTGPLNRVADNHRARTILGWEPLKSFEEGVTETIDWYFASKDRSEVERALAIALTERPKSVVTSRP